MTIEALIKILSVANPKLRPVFRIDKKIRKRFATKMMDENFDESNIEIDEIRLVEVNDGEEKSIYADIFLYL